MTFIDLFKSYFDFIDLIHKDTLFYTIIAFMGIMFVWENYLAYRQYLVESKNKELPKELLSITDQETFEKSRVYAMDKGLYSIVHSIYGIIEAFLMLFYGVLPFVWHLSRSQLEYFDSSWLKNEIAQSNLFIFYFMTFNTIVDLPWSYYHTFVIEQKHGFNKQTPGFFFKDSFKKYLVTMGLTLPIVTLLIYIIRAGGDYFFIYAWLFITIVSLVLITIYADYIAPLFDTFTPLEDGPLKTKIEELARLLNFPLYKLYVVEGSKRSAHSNAYMYGFYKSKRIVIFDTLIEGYKSKSEKKREEEEQAAMNNNKNEQKQEQQAQSTSTEADKLIENKPTENETATSEKKSKTKGCNNEEILAVLAHELGHWKLNHNFKNLVLSQVNTFFYFLIFAVLMNRQVLYECLGFDNEKPVLIGLIVILQFLFAPYNEILSFLMTVLGRRFEFQADEFAKHMGKSEYLKSSLIKLHVDNLTFPISDWLYSTWHYSHPPLLERLRELEEHDHEHKKIE